MIIEKLENWRNIFSGPAWEQAFTALEGLTADSPEGKAELAGPDLYCRVMDYSTRGPREGILEAHREFLDIHLVLRGAERLDWYPTGDLAERIPYDPDKDAAFFERPEGEAPSRVDLGPGIFAVMFPTDAHMPQLMIGGRPETIRKAVVKIRVTLVGHQG